MDASVDPDEIPLAYIVNVDMFSTIRVYQVFNDMCELVFKLSLTELLQQEEEESKTVLDYEVSTAEFLAQVKMMVITTTSNDVFLLSPNFELIKLKFDLPSEEKIYITESLLFQFNQKLFVCLGFSNGNYLVDNFIDIAKSRVVNAGKVVNSSHLNSRVTCITHLDLFGLIAIGTIKGETLLYDYIKKEPFCFQNFNGEGVVQIGTLPAEIKEAKKYIFYVLTKRNLYVLKRARNCLDSFLKLSQTSSPEKHSKFSTQEGINRDSVELDEMVPISDTSQSSISDPNQIK